jgi:uncharacterized protein (TIGR02722 family)
MKKILSSMACSKSPKRLMVVLFAGALTMLANGCGPKAFQKGEYDDVNAENNLDDQWSETDMQKVVADLVAGLSADPSVANAKKKPIVMVTKLQNKTDEHIDTQSITDMLTAELTRTHRVAFVNKAAREDVAEEYNYQNSGMVSGETKKGPGGQTGADFIIDGRLDSIVKEIGKNKTVYYKITLNMTNLKTNVMEWTDYKQIRKKFKKTSVGL